MLTFPVRVLLIFILSIKLLHVLCVTVDLQKEKSLLISHIVTFLKSKNL